MQQVKILTISLLHLGRPNPKEPLLSDDAQQHLWNTPELDYLTHVVFRMYENKRWDPFTAYGMIMRVLFSEISLGASWMYQMDTFICFMIPY